LDGRVVLSKRSDASMCIEHFGGKWQVKPVSSKGMNLYCAYVAGDCALQDCASRVWRVFDGETYVDQASVKLATGREAERQVCGGCTRALRRSPPLCTSQSCLVTPIFTAHLTRISLRSFLYPLKSLFCLTKTLKKMSPKQLPPRLPLRLLLRSLLPSPYLLTMTTTTIPFLVVAKPSPLLMWLNLLLQHPL